MKLTLIAAVDESGLLCDEQGFLWHLPRDIAFFRKYTLEHPHLLVGRTTYEQMLGWFQPQHRAIVLSYDQSLKVPSTLGVRAENVVDALHAAQAYGAKEWVCVGGAQIYEALQPYASDLRLTQVHHRFTPRGKGTYFPDFATLSQRWALVEKQEHPADEQNAYSMSFCHYQKFMK